MKRLLSLAFALALAPAVLSAETGRFALAPAPSCEVQPQNPSCATVPACNNPHCTRCRPNICVKVPEKICIERTCKVPTPKEGFPPTQPREAEGPEEGGGGQMRETGAYVAPPRTGYTRGAASFRGVEGGTITLPELRLRLPTFELPHCFHGRSSARMQIDSAVAPWESHGYVNTGGGAGVNRLQQRITELEEELKKRDAVPPGDAADKAAVERAAADEYAQKLKEYEDLLKQCEEEQKRLRECIQNCLEQHKGAVAPRQKSIQQVPGGKSALPMDGGMEVDPAPAYPKPQPDSSFRRLPTVQYDERPASYLSERSYQEPGRLPIREPGAIREPRPISEPPAPRARVTGIRPAGR